MADSHAQGVSINEMPLPPAIVSVATAGPAFIGYTEKAVGSDGSQLSGKPVRISSLSEYQRSFGGAHLEQGSLSVVFGGAPSAPVVSGHIDEAKRSPFLVYYSLQLFFANGGKSCWIASVGNYTGNGVEPAKLDGGLNSLADNAEVTLLVFPDAVNISSASDYYNFYAHVLANCFDNKNRFTILDIYHTASNQQNWHADIDGTAVQGGMRNLLNGSPDQLQYGAAYFPRLYSSVPFFYTDSLITLVNGPSNLGTLADIKTTDPALYNRAVSALSAVPMLLPAAPAMAGVYTAVDNTLGVWKAPANVNIKLVTGLQYLVSDADQQSLNIDAATGKSVNAIRAFPGHGQAVVWGARTLAGNDNEMRYIPVRRFVNMVQASVANGLKLFSAECNNQSTWSVIQAMIERWLRAQWQSGALMGTTTANAFFVKMGLGQTMTETDLLEGRLIVEIGLAVVRPAEFIILRFSQTMNANCP